MCEGATPTPTYLFVIDVQEYYPSAHIEELQQAVSAAIEWADDNSVPIIVLLMESGGELIMPVAHDLLRARTEVIRVVKHQETGWPALIFSGLLGVPSRCFLCGLNTDICVAATAEDLVLDGHTVSIIADACASHSHLAWELHGNREEIMQILHEQPWPNHEAEIARQQHFGRVTWLEDLPTLTTASIAV
jgi:hypothetical protein